MFSIFFLLLSFFLILCSFDSVFSLLLSVVVYFTFCSSCTINPFQSILSEFLLTNEDYMLLLSCFRSFSCHFFLSTTLFRPNERLHFLSVALKFIYNLMTFGQHTIFFAVDKNGRRKRNTTTKSLDEKVSSFNTHLRVFFFEEKNGLN